MKMGALFFLIPVYNDYESLSMLLSGIKKQNLGNVFGTIKVFIVDDASTDDIPNLKDDVLDISIIRLTRNLGHQKAIAIGLSHIAYKESPSAVVVMDGDGEDRVEDLRDLVQRHQDCPDKIIFAQRRKRKENYFFRLFYHLYKCAFHLLTGKLIRVGNYCLIPSALLKKATHLSDIWNHFSGGLIRSKIPHESIPLDRGPRYKGTTKMNFVSLVIHGLSAIAVYIDVVIVRLFLGALLMAMFSVFMIVVIIYIRLFTPFLIPGWASSTMTGMMIIAMISCFMVFNLLLVVLSYRTQKQFIPAKHYQDYVLDIL